MRFYIEFSICTARSADEFRVMGGVNSPIPMRSQRTSRGQTTGNEANGQNPDQQPMRNIPIEARLVEPQRSNVSVQG